MTSIAGSASAGKGPSRLRRPINVGLLWHSLNSGNLGVGALTLANVDLIREVAEEVGLEPRFTVMGPRDQGTPAVTLADAEVFAIDRAALTSRTGFWRKAGEVDCVLDIGAGDSFAEIYGPRRFAFLWLTKAIVIARGVPLVLAPQTIGPFTKLAYSVPAGWAMRRSRAVLARDRASQDLALKLASSANVKLAVDVAFALPFEDCSYRRGGPKRRVGLNVSGLLLHEAESGRNRFGLGYDYAAFTRRLLSDLTTRDDVEVHLVPHATSNRDSADDDGAAADRLSAEFPQAIRVPNFPGPSEAKSYISGLDFLVAARMHACIAAFSVGTPVVPVAYSRKFDGLFGLLGYDAIVPVRGLDTNGAYAFVMKALGEPSRLAADARAGMGRVAALLDVYRQELRDLFRSVTGPGK